MPYFNGELLLVYQVFDLIYSAEAAFSEHPDRLEGVEAAESIPRQVSDEVVAHVQVPEIKSESVKKLHKWSSQLYLQSIISFQNADFKPPYQRLPILHQSDQSFHQVTISFKSPQNYSSQKYSTTVALAPDCKINIWQFVFLIFPAFLFSAYVQ